MNKREFVLGGAALAVAAMLDARPPLGAHEPARPLARLPDLAAAPDLDHWRSYLGERFTAGNAPRRTALVLEHIAERQGDRYTQQFMLTFRRVGGAPAPSGLHDLRHDNGQRLAVFLEPVAARSGEACVAQFNRLV
ncbi:MAG: DUF6916 family protein [Steroidobacteraceae bacterium]